MDERINIKSLQQECQNLRIAAHRDNTEQSWGLFRNVRNRLKTVIKKTKRAFYQRLLSSPKPREVWCVIHRILNPSPQPLRADPDQLNDHFASTAQRVTGATLPSCDYLRDVVESLPDTSETSFTLRQVLFHEVVSEIKQLRSDCSCGPDKIPVKFIKMVPDQLASVLTHIINNCISQMVFPSAWKIARICPIPKTKEAKCNDDYRPISILPVLSKVYERLVLRQMAAFLYKDNSIFKDSVSAYRKGHTTTSVLLAIKDDIS